MNLQKQNWIFYLALAGILVLDQAVKFATIGALNPGESIPVIQGIFHITYVRNTGAAFSILAGKTGVLLAFTGIVILMLLIYFVKNAASMHTLLKACYVMIIAGGAGNLADRMFRGFVVDSFDFRIWPVFNVADISICVGCGLLMFYVLIVEPRNKKNDKD